MMTGIMVVKYQKKNEEDVVCVGPSDREYEVILGFLNGDNAITRIANDMGVDNISVREDTINFYTWGLIERSEKDYLSRNVCMYAYV